MTGNELPLEVAPLGEHQIDVAAVILAPVDTDPLHVYAIADAVERARKLPASFGPFVRYTTMFGDPLTTATALPEAIALRRGAETPEEGFKAGLHQTPSILGRDAFARLMPVLSRAARFHQKCSPAGIFARCSRAPTLSRCCAIWRRATCRSIRATAS